MNTPTSPGSPVNPATVVRVADELRPAGSPPVPCPAHPLLAGDLRRQGYRVTTGPVVIGRDEDSAAAVFDGGTGLGVALPPTGDADRAAVESSIEAWAALARPRRVLLASPRSFCAGVERAIEAVEELLDRSDGPVYVRKQLVHNAHVVRDLESRGAVFVEEVAEVPAGEMVVFSAHGVSPAVYAEAADRDLRVIDAACPLVTKVHAEARRFAAGGDTIVLIGHAGHEEAEGTMGQAPSRTVLVETADDVARLEVADPGRVAYLTQTTLAVDEVTEVVGALRRRFPALKGPASDDICYATTNRQVALRAVVEDSDAVFVVGSANSSNSRRLVELAERQDTPAYLIDDAGDIRPDWLTSVDTVGLTAGASAPPALVSGVIAALNGLGPVRVTERETSRETVHFALPSQVQNRLGKRETDQ